MAASDYMPAEYPDFVKNCLDARRWACKHLRELAPSMFGDLQLYLDDDLESYNYNYLNNRALLDENGATQEGVTENGSE